MQLEKDLPSCCWLCSWKETADRGGGGGGRWAGPGSWERNIGVSTRPSGKDRALILARKTHFRLVNSRTVGYIYVVLSRVVRGSLQGDEQ